MNGKSGNKTDEKFIQQGDWMFEQGLLKSN